MMQGPIRSIVRERVERRDDARLATAWVGVEQVNVVPPNLTWITHGSLPPSPTTGAPVLCMLGSDKATVINELVAHTSPDTSIYLLVGANWGETPVDSELLNASKVLIRRIPEVPVTAVHTPDGASLWLGGEWSLRLDRPQADALRQIFLRLFWHDATEECWTGGRHLAWRPASERPFDVPRISECSAMRLTNPDAHIEYDAQSSIFHVKKGLPPDCTPRRLWFPAGPDCHDRLSRLVRSGTEVLWQERDLPDLLIGDSGGIALLPGAWVRLHIHLTAAQAAEVVRILEGAASWTFQTDVLVSDPSLRNASFWLPGESESRGVEVEQIREIPALSSDSIRNVPDTNPVSMPGPHPLALSVRYRWTVHPPRVPIATEDDALVGRWRKVDEEWVARVKLLRKTLNATGGERGRVGRMFSRLFNAMLGFERTHGGLLKEIEKIGEQRPSSSGPDGARAILGRLAEIEEQTRKLQVDLEEAEFKAREDEEREKQERAWSSRVEKAKHDLRSLHDELVTAEGRLSDLKKELESVENELESPDPEAKKDISVRRHRLSDEQKRLTKVINRLRGEIGSLERKINEPFEFCGQAAPTGHSAQPSGRFVPSSSKTRSILPVPEEALPEVGSLRSHNGQRYLVIQTWEDLAAGEQAAKRLSANLVAPENT